MTCAQGLLRLLWGGARSWSATGLLHLILDLVFRLVHVLKFVWLDYCGFGQCMIVHTINLVYTQLLHCVIGLDDL